MRRKDAAKESLTMTPQLPALLEPEISGSDFEALRTAVTALERQSFAGRLAGLAGGPISVIGESLSPRLQEVASLAAHKALTTALKVALASLEGAPQVNSTRFHRRLAALSGAFGGAAGLAGLPIELPVSTTIMLRSIADIARHEGENLREPSTALACLEVFALGGHAATDNLLEGGYLAIRVILAKSVTDAARFVAVRGVAQDSAPAMVRLVAQLAARFGVVVSQKAAAQAVPLVGAVSGAAINVAFTEHFQTLARGHFTMRRLERIYNPVTVRSEYARIAREEGYWGNPSAAA